MSDETEYVTTVIAASLVWPDRRPPSPRQIGKSSRSSLPVAFDEHISPTGRPMLTVEEAAQFFGIGRNKGYELAKLGEWPVVMFGRKKLISWPRLWRKYFA